MAAISSQSVIPINDLKRTLQSVGNDAIAAATRAIQSGWWLNGTEAESFCAEFATYVGAKHCIGVGNGTDALEIALRSIVQVKAPSAREVVTVANAGGYTTGAAVQNGLRPVFADIEEYSQLLSIDSAIAALSKETAAVVATHLYGGMVDVAALRRRMDEAGYANVAIIEDCAQAHGARLNGKAAGSLGDLATFSFYPTKNLGAFGDGGAIVSSDSEFFARCLSLRQYGWSAKYAIAAVGGRNSRLDEVQAAILRTLLPHLDAANQRRQAILRRYAEAAPTSVTVVQGAGTVAHLAIVLCDDRDGLKQYLRDRGIMSEIHYPILDCDQTGWKDLDMRIAAGGLPVSRRSVGRLLTLPCFAGLEDAEVERVAEALAAWKA